ncbi:NADPH-dependent FMN reductase [Pontivivens insulae]|uniref:NAD(P)H-dependent FMN reductase n=1 Tax=Pontivivens insulae TaxID=1639689 RepID=A0A2R8AFE3_9RHOB|nr:NAD(P)H-dependent oxidoreductase [Pontivivens insulae]RED12034.1 chromate reductase [Pontivivens insulae]SPF30790.1 NAD(P)H-dependent FMN reductase [Pontivivens insulae]
MTHLVGISGSLREGASNTLLVQEAARLFAPQQFTLADLDLPLLNTDLNKEGGPDAVQRLTELVRGADAVIISTPEYNKMIPGLLKNALDWLSIVDGGNPLKGMPVAIMSSAAGRSGGERAQYTLRHALTPHAAHVVLAPEVTIAGANDAFAEDGTLKDPKSQEFLGKLMDNLKAEITLRG